MIDPYQNVWLKLNELALIKRWSDFYDKDFIYLFNHNEDFTIYEVDLYKFSTLYDKVEGVENTPKIIKMLIYLGEVLKAAIPEIAEQDKEITIVLKKRINKNYIHFHKNFSQKFNVV